MKARGSSCKRLGGTRQNGLLTDRGGADHVNCFSKTTTAACAYVLEARRASIGKRLRRSCEAAAFEQRLEFFAENPARRQRLVPAFLALSRLVRDEVVAIGNLRAG